MKGTAASAGWCLALTGEATVHGRGHGSRERPRFTGEATVHGRGHGSDSIRSVASRGECYLSRQVFSRQVLPLGCLSRASPVASVASRGECYLSGVCRERCLSRASPLASVASREPCMGVSTCGCTRRSISRAPAGPCPRPARAPPRCRTAPASWRACGARLWS